MPLFAKTLRKVPRLTSVAREAKITKGKKIHSIKNCLSKIKYLIAKVYHQEL